MIKVVIVDDTPEHSLRLESKLKEISQPNEVLAVPRNIRDALVAISTFQPDIVFLDVELELGETGFELLNRIGDINFEVVFTTNFVNKYINEIRACSLYYLPKPVIERELEEMVNRILNREKGVNTADQIKTLLANWNSNKVEEIWIPDKGEVFPVPIKNIIFCYSDSPLITYFFKETVEGRQQITITTKTMEELEEELTPSDMCRIDNRILVNLKHVKKYIKGSGGQVVMDNEMPIKYNPKFEATKNVMLSVSRDRKSDLMKRMKL